MGEGERDGGEGGGMGKRLGDEVVKGGREG